MKNLFKSMMLVAAAATGFAACSNDATEEFVNPEVKGATKTITVSTDITRTQFGADRTELAWSADDEFGVFTDVAADKNLSSGTYASATDGAYTLEVSENATMVYAYYPYYKGNSSKSATGVNFGVPETQQWNGPGILYGKNIPMVASGAIDGSNVSLTFKRIACTLALNVYGGKEGETLQSITFTTEENCAGRMDLDITGDEIAYEGNTKSVVVTPYKEAVIPVDATAVANKQTFENQTYLTVVKKSYAAGATFVVKTSENTYTFTTKKALDCSVADFMPVNLDLTKGETPVVEEGVWEQVTALSDITEGTYVIVSDSYYLPSTTTSKSPVKTTNESLSSNKISIENNCLVGTITETMKWYFTGSNTAMTIKNSDGKFLRVSGSSNTGIRVDTTSDTWAFETNGAGFSAKDKTNSRYVATYTSDWRSYTTKNHSNYKDGGILYLYKFKAASAPEPTTPHIATSPIEVPAVGDEVGLSTTAYEVRNSTSAATVTAFDGEVVTEAFIDADGLNYVVAPNYTGEERKGSITLALEDDATVTATIEVVQAADEFHLSIDENTVVLDNTTDSSVKIRVYSTYPWMIETNGDGYTVSPVEYDGTNASYKEVTITATAANETESAIDLGSFVITRTTGEADQNKTISVAVSQSGTQINGGSSVTFDYASVSTTQTGGNTNYTKTMTPIKLVGGLGTNSSNAPRENKAGELRIYTGNTLILSGATITKVIITATSSYSGTWKEGSTTLTTSNAVTTWEGNTTNLTLSQTASKQARVTKIEVFYE